MACRPWCFSESLKGRRFRDLDSQGGMRGGELGGSDNELEEAISGFPFGLGKKQDVKKPKWRAR